MGRPFTRRVYLQRQGERQVLAFFSGAREITDQLALEHACGVAEEYGLSVFDVPGGYLISNGEAV